MRTRARHGLARKVVDMSTGLELDFALVVADDGNVAIVHRMPLVMDRAEGTRLRRNRRSRRSDRCPGQDRKNDPTHCIAKRQAVEKTSCRKDKLSKRQAVGSFS